MTLIKSISGIRGTVGGKPGEGLTAVDIIKFTTGFAQFIGQGTAGKTIVIGRDARTTGEMVRNLVCGTLQNMGFDVVDLGLSTTPTVEIAVQKEKAAGGMIITASHNSGEWNALKLLNERGEFISAADGEKVLAAADSLDFKFSDAAHTGKVRYDETYLSRHIALILNLPLVNRAAIAAAHFRIVVDAVNSTGGIAIPQLLAALGVTDVHTLNCNPDGLFTHNPEPLAENLHELSAEVLRVNANLGIAVDPDVDRLVLMSEDGSLFGEEYTLVAVADYVLSHKRGNTVSNLSSTRALKDVTERYGGHYSAAPVGEVNVVTRMKETNAVIGGEGNGGIILPELHYGRDALVGVALFLTHLAMLGTTMTTLKRTFPHYEISKNKFTLPDGFSPQTALTALEKLYLEEEVNREDGLRINFSGEWVHVRKSNTEPIVRIIAESINASSAEALATRIIEDLKRIISKNNS